MPITNTNRRPGHLRVLVADDNRDNAETTAMLVQHFGYDARAVFDGRQAIDAVAEFDPDVLLLDISMPKLTGWDVARQIRRQSTRRVALIALTGEYLQQSDRALSKIAGFDQYLTKPFDPMQLRDILQRLAERIDDPTKAERCNAAVDQDERTAVIRRLFIRAAQKLGSANALCEVCGIAYPDCHSYLSGEAVPSEEVLPRAVDVVLDELPAIRSEFPQEVWRSLSLP